MNSLRYLAVLLSAAAAGPLGTAEQPPARPNVLFIAVDDLNHWVGYLGRNEQVKTPNIDRLARRGVRFTRSHCAAPLCNPSRAALMSGLRPSTSGVYTNNTDWRKVIGEEYPLTTAFRKAGYYVAGVGKIYHDSMRRDSEWDDYPKKLKTDPQPKGNNLGVDGIRFAPLDCKDEDLRDYEIVTWTLEQLRKKHDKPFFLACGIHKPHMPWNVPRKYYEMYPLDKIVLPKVLEDDLNDIPAIGRQIARPQGDHAAILKSGRWKEAVQAYLAAISYTDMLVGRLLDALDQSPHRDTTAICFWGDHGWHLGEKHHWRKFTLWEEATRAPLLWVVPGVTKPESVCERTVDFMSIYPTLCDVCKVPKPKHVEDPSLLPLLANPAAAWDRPALTTYLFGNHAVRSERWRYIRYHDGSEELYDHTKDPLEWTNLADKPEHAAVKKDLARWFPTVNQPTPPGTEEVKKPKK